MVDARQRREGRSGNTLLHTLPDQLWNELARHSERIVLPAGSTIVGQFRRLTHLFFPIRGAVSVLAGEPGRRIEIACVGSEGVCGVIGLFGITLAPYEKRVQVEFEGYRVELAAARETLQKSPSFDAAMRRAVGSLTLQLAQSGFCNRFHTQVQRLARWLVTVAEKTDRQTFAMTHETLTDMVGGPRHTVSAALSELREGGVIRTSRGQIEIVRMRDLAGRMCQCHERLRQLAPQGA